MNWFRGSLIIEIVVSVTVEEINIQVSYNLSSRFDWTRIKIKKGLSFLQNFEDNEFFWTNGRLLEAEKLTLWNVPPEISFKEKMIFNHLRLKLGNLWTGIASKIMTFYQRVSDHWKREIFPFKLPSHLRRYDFRFPRYHRLKKRWFLIIYD